MMRKLLLSAAVLAGSLMLAGNTAPVFAQGGGGGGAASGGTGAGGDVSTPSKVAPRVGAQKRDDSMNAGQHKPMKHVRYKKQKRKHARM
jgi:hypothetical protein